LTDAQHNWKKAARLWREGDIAKGKKNLVHSIRYLRFGLQIVHNGRVVDYSAGNDTWSLVLGGSLGTEYDAYADTLGPLYRQLRNEMEDHHVKQLNWENASSLVRKTLLASLSLHFSFTIFTQPRQHLALAYMQQFGIAAFERDLCARVRECTQDSRLLICTIDKENAPCGYSMVRDTKLIVVAKDLSRVVVSLVRIFFRCFVEGLFELFRLAAMGMFWSTIPNMLWIFLGMMTS
jgi:hypothetical protein